MHDHDETALTAIRGLRDWVGFRDLPAFARSRIELAYRRLADAEARGGKKEEEVDDDAIAVAVRRPRKDAMTPPALRAIASACRDHGNLIAEVAAAEALRESPGRPIRVEARHVGRALDRLVTIRPEPVDLDPITEAAMHAACAAVEEQAVG